jgi:hypothetical protein
MIYLRGRIGKDMMVSTDADPERKSGLADRLQLPTCEKYGKQMSAINIMSGKTGRC